MPRMDIHHEICVAMVQKNIEYVKSQMDEKFLNITYLEVDSFT